MSVYYIQGGKKILIAGNIPSDILDEMNTSKQAAQEAASAAEASAQGAKTDSDLSRSYAIGTDGEVRPDDGNDNAKKYYEQAKTISESFAGTLRPKGTIAFSELPSISTAEPGDMYNISDDFTTTSDFMEGAGLEIPLGSNIYKTDSEKWDVLAGSPVATVNGMRGNVNVTPENIGALPIEGGTLTGMLTPNGGVSCAGTAGYISYPKDGTFSGASNLTGFLKIKLPTLYSRTFVKFAITIFDYKDNGSVDYYISGYPYSYVDDINWYSCTAVCVGKAGERKANLTVRFGDDGTKSIVTIGEENEKWEFTRVRVHDIMIGYNNASYSTWAQGWAVSINSDTQYPCSKYRPYRPRSSRFRSHPPPQHLPGAKSRHFLHCRAESRNPQWHI